MCPGPETQRRPDDGSSLIEVLVAAALVGLISVALATTAGSLAGSARLVATNLEITRDMDRTDNRLSQDLESYPEIDVSPSALAQLPGTNVLALSGTARNAWTRIPNETVVSYRYVRSGESWNLVRFGLAAPLDPLSSASIETLSVHLEPPGPEWTAGQTPSHAISVTSRTVSDSNSAPVTMRSVELIYATGEHFRTGGTHQDLQQSPTTTVTPAPPNIPVPRCGGSITVVFNASSTIWSQGAASTVTGDLSGFVDSLRGTPSHIRFVAFERAAYSFYPDVSVGTYVDMLNPSTSITALINKLATFSTSSSNWRNGRNWEDGLWQATRRDTGALFSQLPDLVIFLTDGVPNRNRTNTSTDTDTTFQTADLTRAATAADYARSTGATLFGILLGTGADSTATGYLTTVFGTPMWDGTTGVLPLDRARSFVRATTEGFARLDEILALIGRWRCAGTITLQQRVVTNGVSAPPVDSWSFDVAATNTTTPAIQVSVDSNRPSATVDFGASSTTQQRSITVSQKQRTGYRFLSTSCTTGVTSVPVETTTDSTGTTTVRISTSTDVALSCILSSQSLS